MCFKDYNSWTAPVGKKHPSLNAMTRFHFKEQLVVAGTLLIWKYVKRSSIYVKILVFIGVMNERKDGNKWKNV